MPPDDAQSLGLTLAMVELSSLALQLSNTKSQSQSNNCDKHDFRLCILTALETPIFTIMNLLG